jgi:hypothetical protein
MTQRDDAAERSAHVVRNTTAAMICDNPVVEVAPGVFQLRAIAERDAEIARLRAEVETIKSRAEKAEAILDERWGDLTNLRLQELRMSAENGLHMELKAGIIPMIGSFMAAEFQAHGAVNFVALELDHVDLGPLVLTVQRRHGEQPGKVAFEARMRAERAEAERDAARALLPKAWEAGRDACEQVANDAGHDHAEDYGGEYYVARKIAQDIAALAPPPDLAEQRTRETKG